MAEPVEMRIEEVRNILAHFGYMADRIRGSHHIFTKKGCDTIIVPVHNKKLQKRYLKKIKATLNLS